MAAMNLASGLSLRALRRRLIASREILADFAVMALAGLFFAAIGPFDTDTAPFFPERLAYWVVVMLLGAGVILGAERLVGPRVKRMAAPARIGLVALVATPVQTGVVMATGVAVFGYRPGFGAFLRLLPAVLIVTLVAVAVMAIARRARRPGDVRHPVSESAGDRKLRPAPAALARRLPARLRTADLIALEAEDHYVRVHTEAGSELVLMRLRDAIALVGDRSGFRLHRSWWAAEPSLETVRFRRGSGTARLVGGLEAPVSRTYYPALREAGWF